MMTLNEAYALPIPEKYKDTPNIYRLTCIINSSKHRDKIMAALAIAAASGELDQHRKEVENV